MKPPASAHYDDVRGAYCGGHGRTGFGEECELCLGSGSVLVVQPAAECPECKGAPPRENGRSLYGLRGHRVDAPKSLQANP